MPDNVSPERRFVSEISGDPHRTRPHVYGVGRYGTGHFGGSKDKTRLAWTRTAQVVSAVLFMLCFAVTSFAADTFTTDLNLRLPDVDVEDPDTPWGTKLNNNAVILDAAICDKRTNCTIQGNLIVVGSITTPTLIADSTVFVDAPILGNGAASNHLRLDTSSVTLLGPSIALSEIDEDVATQAELDAYKAEVVISTDALDVAKVDRSGDTITGDLRINGTLFQGKKTNAQIQALVCAGGLGDCIASSLTDGDLYTSTGTLAGQYRNARTGKGP